MPRLMSFAKTVPQILGGTKTVTRRDGWLFLKAGDVFEGVEWSPRAGEMFACPQRMIGCRTPTRDLVSCSEGRHWICNNAGDVALCPKCRKPLVKRRPRRLGLFKVVLVSREPLGVLNDDDIRREGFGHWPIAGAAERFIAMYCAPGPPDALRVVTRIEFKRI